MASRSLEYRRCHSASIAVLTPIGINGGSRAKRQLGSMAYNRLTTIADEKHT